MLTSLQVPETKGAGLKYFSYLEDGIELLWHFRHLLFSDFYGCWLFPSAFLFSPNWGLRLMPFPFRFPASGALNLTLRQNPSANFAWSLRKSLLIIFWHIPSFLGTPMGSRDPAIAGRLSLGSSWTYPLDPRLSVPPFKDCLVFRALVIFP